MPSVYLSASCQEKNIGIDGVSEENRMQALAKVVAIDLRKLGVKVLLNDPHWTLSQVIVDSNTKKTDLHLALHSNAGKEKNTGSGTETWCFGLRGTKSAAFGKKLQSAVVNVLELPDRGIKNGAEPDHRLGEIVNVFATSVLIELFFHDNAKDVARYKERASLVAAAITKTVADWFGVHLQPSTPKK